ncbi:MAG: copper transporter [Firmicutes bacterium]|nr:copper transporter [Bacillota bacterium]
MISPRYHVTSTVAIFFALGLGIFLGSSLVKDDVLIKHQQSLIDGIESEFNLIRKDREILYAKLETTELLLENTVAFGEMALAKLICGKLDDKHIDLVVAPQGLSREGVSVMIATLQDSGASLGRAIHIKGEFGPMIIQKLASFIAGPILHGENLELTEASHSPDSEYLTVEFLNENQKCDAVVIALGNKNQVHDVAYTNISLIKALRKLNIPMVIIMSGKVGFPFNIEYRLQGVRLIENADTLMGRFSLVEGLFYTINGG